MQAIANPEKDDSEFLLVKLVSKEPHYESRRKLEPSSETEGTYMLKEAKEEEKTRSIDQNSAMIEFWSLDTVA